MNNGSYGGYSAVKAERADTQYMLMLRAVSSALFAGLMSCARIMDASAPFGIAAVACAGVGLNGVCALAGAAAAYLFSGGLEWGIRYVAACVLVYTLEFVFHEMELYKQSLFMPSCAALVMIMTGLLSAYTVGRNNSVPLAARLALETVLSFGAAYFFAAASEKRRYDTEAEELRRSTAILVTCCCVLIALSRLMLFATVSVGRVAAIIFLMCSAMKGGMLPGAAVGTAAGIAMDISNPGTPYYVMLYAFSGLFSGVYARHGRVIFLISYISANAIAVLCAWNESLYFGALMECFCASVLFMLMPTEWVERAALLRRVERGRGETGLRRYVAGRVRNLSDAYSELYTAVKENVSESANDNDIAKIFDRAADAVCIKCRYKNRCWNQEYMDTLSAMNDASKAMQHNGRLDETDLPDWFREKCPSLPVFAGAVNSELRALSFRREMQRRMSENRAVAWGQYLDMAEILGGVAQELGSINGAEPLIERRIIRYMKTLGADGDASCYRDSSGRLRITIEGGQLIPLTSEEDYLECLSSIAGVRLSRADTGNASSKIVLLEAEPLAVSVGVAAMKKQGESVSGDRGSYFKTDSGVLCVILSDGMGTGEDAAEDSARVVGILEKFLRSGVDPAAAMKLLNSVMLLRSADSWGYATVDLMCIDLFSGEACFYKYGAAPSYVKSGKTIKRIKGETFAAGLSVGEGIMPDLVRMRLKPGNTAIIASDGVVADGDDEWLREILEAGAADMKTLAAKTLREAEKIYGAADDMTVVTVCVEARV